MPGHNPAPGHPALDRFLQSLARAVKQFHTYPATSPMCEEAAEACHSAFTALDGSEWLVLRVTAHEFLIDDLSLGAGTIVEHELVRRLHHAHVASLHFDPSASLRDVTRLCADVVRLDNPGESELTFAELLVDHGVETIVAQMAQRPEVLNVGTRPAPVWDLVARESERRRSAVATGPTQYLYPPEKGWVRLDPGSTVDAVSLIDLALLVDDPAEIARMLLRLTGDDQQMQESERALEHKFTDVAKLFGALDGPLAQMMFSKLARAVLAIPAERRQELLRRTILPGLFDGRPDGTVLSSFPDADLAESLCLLLDLETAAPEVVTAALNRLELSEERRRAVESLVDERMTASSGPSREAGEASDRYARRLVRVDAAESKSFADYAAFDLSVDDATRAAVAEITQAIAATDLVPTQIDCLWRLVRLEPNPTTVEVFLRCALLLLNDLEQAGRWRDLGEEAAKFGALAESLREPRPDVAEAIVAGLGAFCTRGRAVALVELHARDDAGREEATRLIEAFGPALAPSFVAVLDEPSLAARTTGLVPLLCEHAALLAPGLVAELDRAKRAATRGIVRACGFAGVGYEEVIGRHLTSPDEQTVREALRSLARIGSPRAASLIGSQIEHGSAFARAAAAEALWHLPPPQRTQQLRHLLGRREFVVQNPPIASRLIERAAQTDARGDLKGVLDGLESLRFRFWNPALMRVAWKARELREP